MNGTGKLPPGRMLSWGVCVGDRDSARVSGRRRKCLGKQGGSLDCRNKRASGVDVVRCGAGRQWWCGKPEQEKR